MQRKLAVLAVTLLTLTAGCIGSLPMNTDTNAESVGDTPTQNASGSDQTVVVSANGQVQTEPERAVVQVAVTARADSVETVREQLAENASQLRAALKEAGLDPDHITTTRYDISRNHGHERNPSEPKYEGQHAFVITVNETARAGEVVVTAVENGATRVGDIRFTITQETRTDLREQALSKAIENARGKAMVAANGTGLRLAGVRTVQTADISTQEVQREKAYRLTVANSGGGGDSTPTSFESGTVTVTAEVVVVFNATSG